MNFKSILVTAATVSLLGGAASASTIGVAVDGLGGSAVAEAQTIGAADPGRAGLAATAGVGVNDVIGYFIPLSGGACTYGVDCGTEADNGNGGGPMSMFVQFENVDGGDSDLHLFFEDLDLVGGNDPLGFFESLTLYDANDDLVPLATFVNVGDDGIVGDDGELTVTLGLGELVAGITYTARLDFSSQFNIGGPNSPEFLAAVLKGPEPVPLPAGILLMGTAVAGIGVMSRRKKRSAA